MRKHVPHFEVLRGVAALWVLLSHVLLIVDIKVRYLGSGDQAVQVFVILSGFVIGLMRANEDEPYGRYIFRRFARLYPLFLIALIYGALTDHLYGPVFGASPWMEQESAEFQTRESDLANFFWQHLILHLTILHGAVPDTILPQAALTFSGPLWSISLEWQFYLIAPFLIAVVSFGSWRKAAISAVILIVAILLARVTYKAWEGGVQSFLPLQLPLFIVGIMSASLWHRAREATPTVLAVAVIFSIVLVSRFSSNMLPLLIWGGVYFMAAAHDKWSVAKAVDRVVSSAVPRFLGKVSYGLYVLHVPTMMLVSYYVVFPLFEGLGPIVAAVAIAAITLPISLGLAYISFTYLESPIIKWARQVSRRDQTPLIGVL